MFDIALVLGSGFTTKVIDSGFKYPGKLKGKVREIEKEKIKKAKDFYKDIKRGDDKTIYRLAMADLNKNINTTMS